MSAPGTGAIVDTGHGSWERVFRTALEADRPMVLVLRPGAASIGSLREGLPRLIGRAMPVTAVLAGRVAGARASLALGCDTVRWVQGSSLRFTVFGAGEASLLALRLGRAGAARVWFDGGLLHLAEARRAGWATAERDARSATSHATRSYGGLAPEALSLLRPLLYHQAGLGLPQAEALERAAFGLAFTTDRPAEGIRAFLEKRKPKGPGGSDRAIE